MNIHRLLFFITIALWSMSVYSEDCMVTTQARSLMTDSTLLQEEQLAGRTIE